METASGPAQGAPGGAPAAPPIRALLLEDSAFDRQRLRRMGRQMDRPITIDEAPDLASLRGHIDETAYDLILIDYGLGSGDGLQALDTIAESEANRGAAKIMITGNQRTDLAVSALKGGCHDFLTKDAITPEGLSRAITEALDRARASRPAPHDAAAERVIGLNEEALRGALLGILAGSEAREVMTDQMAEALRQAAGRLGLTEMPADGDLIGALVRHFTEADHFDFGPPGADTG